MGLRRRSARTVSFAAFGVRLQLSFANPGLTNRVEEILSLARRHCGVGASATRFAPRTTGPCSDEYAVSSAQGLLSRHVNSAPAQDRPEGNLRTLGRKIPGPIVLEGDRGEAAPAAIALLAVLASRRG
jgi:hypothetical protein